MVILVTGVALLDGQFKSCVLLMLRIEHFRPVMIRGGENVHWHIFLVVVLCVLRRAEQNLLNVTLTRSATGVFARSGEHREQDGGQNRDDRYYDQEFYQGEPAPFPVRVNPGLLRPASPCDFSES